MKDKVFEEKWLIGISGIYKNTAYFYQFENEFSPARKGIIAFDLRNQNILWENYNYVLENISYKGILAFNSRIQPRRFELLDPETGLLLKNVKQEEISEYPTIINKIQIPDSHFSEEITQCYQELKINNLDIRSGYKKQENTVNHILEIYRERNLIFTDYLAKDIQKVSPDTFFVWFNRLVYIKDKSEIVVYLL